MLLGGCSSFPKYHDSLLPSVIGLFHKVLLNGSVSIPGSCVRITCKIQTNKIDAFTDQGRPESKLTLYVPPVRNQGGGTLIFPLPSLELKTATG